MTCPHCHLEDLGGLHGPEGCVEVLAEVLQRVSIAGPMILPREPVDHDAYRQGLCCDCGQAQHSAGRPRCQACHDRRVAAQATYKPGLKRDRLGHCGRGDCRNPTLPGSVICAPCGRELDAAIDHPTRGHRDGKP